MAPQVAREAKKAQPAQKPRAERKRVQPVAPAPKPVQVPKRNEPRQSPPSLSVGSLSQRGTVEVPMMSAPGLKAGTPTESANPILKPNTSPRIVKGEDSKGAPSAGKAQAQKRDGQPRAAVKEIEPVAPRRKREFAPAQVLVAAHSEQDVQTLQRLIVALDEVAKDSAEKKAKNSRGVKEGSKNPLPPLPLPDSDSEIGDGSGLKGEYFQGRTFEQYIFTRSDPNIQFNWPPGDSPNPRLPFGSDYSIRWTGKIMPKFSENYTFYVAADDGVRLWINHKLIIDDWTLHPGVEYQGQVPMEAGKQFDIRVDYFNGAPPHALAYLYWESASQPKEFVPSAALFYPLAGDKSDLSKDEAPHQ